MLIVHVPKAANGCQLVFHLLHQMLKYFAASETKKGILNPRHYLFPLPLILKLPLFTLVPVGTTNINSVPLLDPTCFCCFRIYFAPLQSTPLSQNLILPKSSPKKLHFALLLHYF